ncbi:MAG: hypothetical protein LBC65_06530 [Oscillospiraceae bacterium]|nr:hypothetical protein [Oscillospiraceae bacterium]
MLSIMVYPIAAVLLGTSLLGGVLVPLLVGLKGFALSFSLSVMFSTMTRFSDRWQFLRLRAIPTLISVTVLFVLSVQALHSSLTLFKLAIRATVNERLYGSRYWINLLICAIALTVAAILSNSL